MKDRARQGEDEEEGEEEEEKAELREQLIFSVFISPLFTASCKQTGLTADMLRRRRWVEPNPS